MEKNECDQNLSRILSELFRGVYSNHLWCTCNDRRLDKFKSQELANTAWAFATVGQQDE